MLKSWVEKDRNPYVRRAAVQELARGWQDDPDTLPYLKQRAQQDESYAVRRAAVQELARGWRSDPTLIPFLRERSTQDPFKRRYNLEDNPRQIALRSLLQIAPQDPRLPTLLQDRATNDPDAQLREYAREQLIRLQERGDSDSDQSISS